MIVYAIVYARFQATIAKSYTAKIVPPLLSLTPDLPAMVAIFSIAWKPGLLPFSGVQIKFDGPI